MRPLFLTFEGLDGSGKTTHLRSVARWLRERGLPHRVTKEPGGTPLGEAVRRVFLDSRWGAVDGTVELLLVFASRRQQLIEVIDPALGRGEHVLCDRFTDSTRAYQGAGRGVPPDLIDAVDRVATGARVPDRTLLFDLPADLARQRGAHPDRLETEPDERRLDEEDLEFYRRVREGFLALARAEPDRFRVIDSSGPKQATSRQVRAALADVIGDDSRTGGSRTEGATGTL